MKNRLIHRYMLLLFIAPFWVEQRVLFADESAESNIDKQAEALLQEAIAEREQADKADHLLKEAQASLQSEVSERMHDEKKESVEEKKEEADIFLNFEEVSLASLVTYITERHKMNVIPDKALEQIKVSVKTERPYTLTQALSLLHTLLEKNGYSMVEVAGVHRILQRTAVGQHPIQTFSSMNGVEPEDLPQSDKLIRYIYYLKNIKVQIARDILISMLGDGTVEMQQELDVFIVTQKSNSIKSAMKIIKELDQSGLRQSIKIISVMYQDVDAIARLFNDEIIGQKKEESIRFISPAGKKESAYFSSSTKVIPDPERRALILMGQEKDIDRIIDFIYIMDKPSDSDESRLIIRNVQHIQADQAKAILDRMIRPPQGGTDKQALAAFKLFQDVVIAAETPKNGDQANYGCGNRLIIACNKEARPALLRLIDDLDRETPQVALEMMIVDVTQNLARELSAQMRNKSSDLFGGNLAFQTAHAAEVGGVSRLDGNLASLIASAEKGSELTLGNPGDSFDSGNIWFYLRALLQEDQSNILSQPFLTVNNRESCTLTTNDIRRVAGDFVAGAGRSGGLANTDLEANTTIQLTPRINDDGIVDLTIVINLVEFIKGNDENNPNRQIRKLETRSVMAEGEVLILGGLSKSNQTQAFWHTPLLSRIPIFGNLFKGRTRERVKQNLFIFIRPSIIKPRNEGNPDDYTQMKIDYAKYQTLNVDGYSDSKDPIQRWFFKPRNQDVKQRLKDLRAGIFRPIDDFKEGKDQPAQVNVAKDPYFQGNLKFESEKKKQKEKLKRKVVEEVRPTPLVFSKKNEERKKVIQEVAPRLKIRT